MPAGTVTIQVRRLGYQPKTVTGVLLNAGATLEQDITMDAATITLTAQVVTASAERGSVNEALDAQRVATGVVNAITSEQISRSPDSDAAQAVQRVSGVTVQGGRYVFVRGLGERYTTAQLNGTRIPSPEPEMRVVPLDLFPAGLLQTITTQKTFTPDQQGDFSGGQVDIKRLFRIIPLRCQAVSVVRLKGEQTLDKRERFLKMIVLEVELDDFFEGFGAVDIALTVAELLAEPTKIFVGLPARTRAGIVVVEVVKARPRMSP